MNTLTSDFYIVGGNLRRDAPCYVERRADTDLYETLKRGEFCYILTSRQMGKSSLMVRVAHRLREEGTVVIALDLTQVGLNVTAEQWYDGLLTVIGRQLDLEDELEEFFCDEHQQLGPLQRWMAAIEQVVLARTEQPVVIFMDEIDYVRSLRERFSTDEFFAAIRHCYNARTDNDALRRLTFCLIGVATPTELIEDVRITPFNIGRRIELSDFTETEAAWFTQGLGREEAVAQQLLQRIFYWTNGHPYLIQRLCHAVASDPAVTTAAGVDRLCEEIFLSTRSQETDTNLSFVRDRLLRGQHDHAAILDLYQQVRRQKRVRDDETSPLINLLRLAGLVRVLEDYLWVRNRIYFRVFDQAWIDANMPDAEKRRQRAAYRRGLIRASVAATAIITAIGGGIYWYFDSYVWEHVAYCNTYAKRFGIMQCVGELTKEQVQGRATSYKFIHKGRQNPVWKVQAVRGLTGDRTEASKKEGAVSGTQQGTSDMMTTRHDIGTYFKSENQWQTSVQKPTQWEFVLDANGKIVYEKAFTAENKLVWGLVYSPPLEGQPAHAHYVGDDGYPRPQAKSTAEFVEFSYSEQGDEIKVRYFDRAHQPQVGLDGAFVIEKQFDFRGLTIGQAYFDATGKAVLTQDGYHKWTAQYDAQGNQIEATLFDTDGQPILHKTEGWHQSKSQFDARGNQIERTFFGTDGQPILLKEYGYHQWKSQFDAWGNQIESAYFGTDGQPILSKEGYHQWKSQFDAWGNEIETAFFGTDGQPILLKEGLHKWTAQFDARGNEIERAFFGTDGQPILLKDGSYHQWKSQYDERGNKIETAYFGTDGQPILLKDGYHQWTAQFDARGNMIEEAYFGTDGQPILHKDGYHKWAFQYDVRGNVIERVLFDTDGQPILDKEHGLHKETSQYDARGNMIEQAFFGTDGQPILLKEYGYHKWTSQYDARGNMIEQASFGTDGQPILIKEYDFHKWIAQFDARGNVIETAYFGTDGQPILYKYGGYHKKTSQFDARGNEIEQAYFGTDGQPILLKDGGYHQWKSQFDARGNEIEIAYFDTKGNPVLHNRRNCHKRTLAYDDQGTQIAENHFDVNGNPLPTAIYVSSVKSDSPAAQLGLQENDKITDYNGEAISDLYRFLTLRRAEQPDQPAKELKIERQGKILTFQIPPKELEGMELENRAVSKGVN